jgi:hypothetical protein
MSLLYLQESVLSIKTGVLSQSSWYDKKSISKSVNTKLNFTLSLGLCEVHEMFSTSNFE